MRASHLVAYSVLLTACRLSPAPVVRPGTDESASDPFAVVREVDRMAEADLWPGFDPRTVPVAIFDGRHTIVFRHPTPPPGFEPMAGHPGVVVHVGRHNSVTANSSVELGGVMTATLMPASQPGSLRVRAGTLVHEAFHAFQRQNHPRWSANEVDLFTYPVSDSSFLTLRRMESETLRRAILSGESRRVACWSRAAMELRRERLSQLEAGAVAYERLTELNEGLATYVELRATAEPDSTLLGAEEFAPEAVRLRSYQSGAVLARLLDRLAPTWRTTLSQRDSTSLDELLTAAVDGADRGTTACVLTAGEREQVEARAGRDVRDLHVRRTEMKRGFLEQPGWRVIIVAGSTPLFPQGFDPWNVQAITPSEVLHTRFLKLGNGPVTVEVLGATSLTEAAGTHPLFNGVRTVTVAGLASEPMVTEVEGVVTLVAQGVAASLGKATVAREGRTLTVRLP